MSDDLKVAIFVTSTPESLRLQSASLRSSDRHNFDGFDEFDG
jgi:hypothetical protein